MSYNDLQLDTCIKNVYLFLALITIRSNDNRNVYVRIDIMSLIKIENVLNLLFLILFNMEWEKR